VTEADLHWNQTEQTRGMFQRCQK